MFLTGTSGLWCSAKSVSFIVILIYGDLINEKMQHFIFTPDISEAEIELVSEALCSGWITTGPKTKLLEKKIAEWVGTPKSVCLNSQTACAEVSLRILGIGAGDEVIGV